MLHLDVLIESNLLLETAGALGALKGLFIWLFSFLGFSLGLCSVLLSDLHDILRVLFSLAMFLKLLLALVDCHADQALVDIDCSVVRTHLLLHLLLLGLLCFLLWSLLLLHSFYQPLPSIRFYKAFP